MTLTQSYPNTSQDYPELLRLMQTRPVICIIENIPMIAAVTTYQGTAHYNIEAPGMPGHGLGTIDPDQFLVGCTMRGVRWIQPTN